MRRGPLNLAYRWFCRLGLEDAVPDHSTFSKNRHGRFRESEAFRHVFESVVERCMKEGLVGGEGFAVDASVIKADANRSHRWRAKGRRTCAIRGTRHGPCASISCPDTQEEPVTAPRRSRPLIRGALDGSGRPSVLRYSTNYLVDVQAGIIVDVEATPTCGRPKSCDRTMIERVEERFDPVGG